VICTIRRLWALVNLTALLEAIHDDGLIRADESNEQNLKQNAHGMKRHMIDFRH